MRICAAQLEAVRGDIAGNVRRHLALIDLASSHDADLVLFPELSLTGYEPTLAAQLATDASDERLGVFQAVSDYRRIIIGVGLPTRAPSGVRISLVVFQPRKDPATYSKQRLHRDELPYFACGDRQLLISAGRHKVAPAICFESLQPEHADAAARMGADIYLASVAKSHGGLLKAYEHYPAMARQHSMIVLMASCTGRCDDFVSRGQSAVWNEHGERVAKMDDEGKGIVVFDTETGEAAVVHWQEHAAQSE
jgi:predicted amidohydrolase